MHDGEHGTLPFKANTAVPTEFVFCIREILFDKTKTLSSRMTEISNTYYLAISTLIQLSNGTRTLAKIDWPFSTNTDQQIKLIALLAPLSCSCHLFFFSATYLVVHDYSERSGRHAWSLESRVLLPLQVRVADGAWECSRCCSSGFRAVVSDLGRREISLSIFYVFSFFFGVRVWRRHILCWLDKQTKSGRVLFSNANERGTRRKCMQFIT